MKAGHMLPCATFLALTLLLGGCPAPMETQVRSYGPSTGGTVRPEGGGAQSAAPASLPAISGVEGYVLLPQRLDTRDDADAVACIARSIADAAPAARQIPFEHVRDSLFPWLEPGTKPSDEDDLLELVKRPRLQERLRSLNVRYFVHVGGRRTMETPRNHFACTLTAGCGDLTIQKHGAQLSATLFDLHEGVALGGRDASARGTSTALLVGIVPIMFIAPTDSQVCGEVGAAIAKAFAAGEQR